MTPREHQSPHDPLPIDLYQGRPPPQDISHILETVSILSDWKLAIKKSCLVFESCPSPAADHVAPCLLSIERQIPLLGSHNAFEIDIQWTEMRYQIKVTHNMANNNRN